MTEYIKYDETIKNYVKNAVLSTSFKPSLEFKKNNKFFMIASCQ